MASDTEELVLSISADTRQIMNAIKRLEKDINASAAGVRKSFEGIGKGIDRSIDTTVQRQINEIAGIGARATKEWTGALSEQGKELERMRARFNPIFAVVTRYKATVGEIQTAQRLGAISTDEMTAAIQSERQAALSSIAVLKQRNAVLDAASRRGGRVSNFNTANIAAQLQDIGVTAAMGMSPLQIALQQGTQLSAVLNGMGNARSVISGLGAAFASIINPVSLVTIGVVGLTAAALQLSAAFLNGSGDVQKALDEHSKTVSNLRKAYGLAGEGAEEYSRRSIAALEAAERRARAVLREAIAAQEKGIRTALSDFGFSGFGLLERFGVIGDRNLSAVSARFAAFAEPIRQLRQEIQQGQPDYNAFQRKLDEIAATDPSRLRPVADEISHIIDEAATGRESLASMSLALDQITENQFDTARIVVGFKNIEEAAQNAQGAAGEFLRMLGHISQVASGIDAKGDAIGGAGSMERASEAFRAQLNLWRRFGYDDDSGIDPNKPKKTPAAKTPRRTADDRFFEDIEAIRQRTAALAEEYNMLGSAFEAQTKRKVAFDLEQQALKQVREEARRKGDQDWQNARLTPAQVQQIDEVSSAYARQADQLRKAQEVMGLQRDILKGVFSDFRSALADGKIEAKEWGDIVINVLDKIINKIEDELIDAILEFNSASGDPWGGMRSTGSGGSLFGFLGSLLGGLFRASGGPVKKGQPYIVGEKRPELFVPDRSGTILPRVPQMPALAGGAGSGSQGYVDNRTINIDARGAQAGVGQEIATALKAYDAGRKARLAADLPELRRRGAI